MSRKDAIEWVRQLLIKSRGRELPGSFNPLLVGELSRDQSVNWETIAREHVKKIWVACRQFLEKLLSCIADDGTIASLFTNWIDPKINKKFEDANKALD